MQFSWLSSLGYVYQLSPFYSRGPHQEQLIWADESQTHCHQIASFATFETIHSAGRIGSRIAAGGRPLPSLAIGIVRHSATE
jgi:hypothetical protein